MAFEGLLELTEDNVEENKCKRSSFKFLGNSMLGKFSQRLYFSQSVYAKSQQDIEEAAQKHNIVDILPISENICELEILPSLVNQHSTKSSMSTRSGNCVIGAFITAHARIQLHKDVMALKARGYEPYYCDTDGIIFLDPNPTLCRPLPLSLSPCLGDYKHELGNQIVINSFACLARKTYSLSFFDKSKNHNEICVKSSGLSLSSTFAKKSLNSTDFHRLLSNWQKKEMSVEIPQLRNFIRKETGNVDHRVSSHKLSNKVNIQRIVHNISGNTIPFGYDRKKKNTE